MFRPLAQLPPRRDFLQHFAFLAASGAAAATGSTVLASAPHAYDSCEDSSAVLVDLSVCIGCRRCEHACREANGINPGPLSAYDDTSVFRVKRRPSPTSLTVINQFQASGQAVYTKSNCLHCNHPACVSACIVGALRKRPGGAVTYDAWKCIGCRYCMVACPFQIPAYEYDKALTPRVRKCEFCFERTERGEKPACIAACPREAMTFGKRRDLLKLAHDKIARHPRRYIDHVYGEHEVGGTSWMYLSPAKFEQVGFQTLGNAAPPVLTESIQHGVFKHWIAPVTWYSFLLAAFFRTRKQRVAESEAATHVSDGKDTPHAVAHVAAAPARQTFRTPGVAALLALMLTGIAFWIYRMVVGLAASTNLDHEHPWGLWIAMDVGSGIALAGGGFIAAAIFHVFHRERYHMLARSALVTALLGYTFYVPGLLADLGKWWKLPITMYPPCWQANSVLFEVGMCVMIYLTVQYAELIPIVCQRLLGESWMTRWPRVLRCTQWVRKSLDFIMPALLCLGVALSTFHQSSLGNLLVIAPYKLHALWWSPWSPLFFLLSAAMVGLPMVIFTILFASWSLHREPEMHALTPLARKYVPVFLAAYLIAKVADMIWRGTGVYLIDGSHYGLLWIAEMLLVALPLAMFLMPGITRSARPLGAACLLVILGVVLNRLNVFVLAFRPPFESKPYVPSLTEVMVSLGLVAALILTYRLMVTFLPILEPGKRVRA